MELVSMILFGFVAGAYVGVFTERGRWYSNAKQPMRIFMRGKFYKSYMIDNKKSLDNLKIHLPKETKRLKTKLYNYKTALIQGRKHHENCYGDPHCGCFCGLEKELEKIE